MPGTWSGSWQVLAPIPCGPLTLNVGAFQSFLVALPTSQSQLLLGRWCVYTLIRNSNRIPRGIFNKVLLVDR